MGWKEPPLHQTTQLRLRKLLELKQQGMCVYYRLYSIVIATLSIAPLWVCSCSDALIRFQGLLHTPQRAIMKTQHFYVVGPLCTSVVNVFLRSRLPGTTTTVQWYVGIKGLTWPSLIIVDIYTCHNCGLYAGMFSPLQANNNQWDCLYYGQSWHEHWCKTHYASCWPNDIQGMIVIKAGSVIHDQLFAMHESASISPPFPYREKCLALHVLAWLRWKKVSSC